MLLQSFITDQKEWLEKSSHLSFADGRNQVWQLPELTTSHDTISEENGTQDRDLLSLCLWQSYFPDYNKHPRMCYWTKLEIKTPKAWKPFNCYWSISGSAWRPSQGGKYPFTQDERIANNSGWEESHS